MLTRRLMGWLAATAPAAAPAAVNAQQDYTVKPVRLIVPSTPGVSALQCSV